MVYRVCGHSGQGHRVKPLGVGYREQGHSGQGHRVKPLV